MNNELLEKLEEIWKNHPALRFGQLLENALGCRNNTKELDCWFYLEDEDLIEALEEFDNRTVSVEERTKGRERNE